MFDSETHLFIFRRQGVTLRYAAADRDIVIGEHTYQAAQIERDAIRQTAERAKDKLKIRVAYLLTPVEPDEGWPVTQELGNWWRPYIPSDSISVVCLSHRPGSLDPPHVEWMGWAVSPVYTDTQFELGCDPNPPHGSLASQGPKLQRACFKTVYSTGPRGCNLNPSGFELVGEVAVGGVDGLTLLVPEFIDTPFALIGGALHWTRADGLVEERPIVAHDSATGAVSILWGGEGLRDGLEVTALPNCPGTWAACAARRPDPQLHYGGAIYKPAKDPIVEGRSMSWG